MRSFIAFVISLVLVPGICLAHPSLSTFRIDVDGYGSYEINTADGLRYSADGITWEPRNIGLPEKIVYPFDHFEYREILDLSVDPTDPLKLAVVTDSHLLVSDDGGKLWNEVSTQRPISRVEIFTSVERVPGTDDTIYLGSSFNGLYVTGDGGESWESLEERLPELYLGAGFNEEIRALAISASNPDVVIVAAGFGGGVYLSDDGGVEFSPYNVPGTGAIVEMHVRLRQGTEELVVVREDGTYIRTHLFEGSEWTELPEALAQNDGTPAALLEDPDLKKPDSLAADRTGIYVNSVHATGDRLEAHLDLLDEHGMNSIVVDMKDDSGYLTYDTALEMPKTMNAIRERFNLHELVERAHERGVYLIGRVVVFQDRKLFHYDSGAYAVWNTETDEPWGNFIPVRNEDGEIVRREQREFWVDPFCEAVWDYNIAIALELESRGVDEVQFDYIRFPSDGDTSTIEYRFARENMAKSDALESFLKKAHEELEIPVGVDVFGFNGWYLMGNWIGQNISTMARWVDVISPMYYPSHYPRAFLPDLSYFDRARAIYEIGSDRAALLVEGMAYIRPYVQAFLIGGERNFEEDQYIRYLAEQLDGVIAAKASGFTLWNASNNYYMVATPLISYTSAYSSDLD